MLLFDGEDPDAVAAARARWSEAKANGFEVDLLAGRRAGALAAQGIAAPRAKCRVVVLFATGRDLFCACGRNEKGPGLLPGALASFGCVNRSAVEEPVALGLDGQASAHEVAFGIEVVVSDGQRDCKPVAQNAVLPLTS